MYCRIVSWLVTGSISKISGLLFVISNRPGITCSVGMNASSSLVPSAKPTEAEMVASTSSPIVPMMASPFDSEAEIELTRIRMSVIITV